jgi:membrane protease YdiL (CAAX protease family)
VLAIWAAALLGSALPYILLRELARIDAPWWLLPGEFVALLAIATWPAARPARPYVLLVAAFVVGKEIKDLMEATAFFVGWSASASDHERLFVDPFLQLFPVAAVALASVGLTRRQLYLVPGDVSRRITVRGMSLSWRSATPLFAAIVAGPLLVQLSYSVRPDPAALDRGVAALPAAALFAVVNAAGEEFRFRAAPLARLLPLLGPWHALLVTSVVFGVGHFYGHPSGASGAALAVIAGLLFGIPMLATRGFVASWIIHGVQDVLIFAAVVMGER